MHLRRIRYWTLVRAAECRLGIPVGLLDALILAESRYVERARSPVGAAGLTQLMPATASQLGIFDRDDPPSSIDGGARYLRARLDQFGSVPLAVAAYNAGPGAVLKARGIPLNRETPSYVSRVFGFWSATRLVEASASFAQQLLFTGSSPD